MTSLESNVMRLQLTMAATDNYTYIQVLQMSFRNQYDDHRSKNASSWFCLGGELSSLSVGTA